MRGWREIVRSDPYSSIRNWHNGDQLNDKEISGEFGSA